MNRFVQFLLTVFLIRALAPVVLVIGVVLFFLVFYLLLGIINFTTQAGF